MRGALDYDMPSIIKETHRLIPSEILLTHIFGEVMTVIAGEFDRGIHKVVHASKALTIAQVEWHRAADQVDQLSTSLGV